MFKRIAIIFLAILVTVPVYAGSQQTSSTTAATIITYARHYLNEPSATFWTDAELLVWVNQGTMDIVSRTRCLEGTEDLNLAADTIEYAMTSDYIDITTVIYVDASSVSKGLIRKNPQSIGNIPNAEEPAWWYEWAGKIGAYPTLSAATTEKITVYYVSSPASVASGESVLVPAIYDRALTLYITAQAWAKAGQFAKSGRFMAEYLAELDRYRVDFVDRPSEPEDNVR